MSLFSLFRSNSIISLEEEEKCNFFKYVDASEHNQMRRERERLNL
jgi:hypothetical protein